MTDREPSCPAAAGAALAPDTPRAAHGGAAECYVSTDPALLDRDRIHAFLSRESAWARGLPRSTFERSLAHSLCFGLYRGAGDDAGQHQQLAFARVVTDRATFANLVDVFVLPEARGQGHALRLLDAVFAHPDLQGLRRFTLATRNAHGLYARYGFAAPNHLQTLMERLDNDVYTRGLS